MLGEIYEFLMSHFLIRTAFFGLCFVLAIMVLLYNFQNSMLYIPGIAKMTESYSALRQDE
jgi:hypothetical protein